MTLSDFFSGAFRLFQQTTGTANFEDKVQRLLDMPIADVQASLLEYLRHFTPIQRASFQTFLQAGVHPRAAEVSALGTLFEGLKLQHPDFVDGPLGSKAPQLIARGLEELRRAREQRSNP